MDKWALGFFPEKFLLILQRPWSFNNKACENDVGTCLNRGPHNHYNILTYYVFSGTLKAALFKLSLRICLLILEGGGEREREGVREASM